MNVFIWYHGQIRGEHVFARIVLHAPDRAANSKRVWATILTVFFQRYRVHRLRITTRRGDLVHECTQHPNPLNDLRDRDLTIGLKLEGHQREQLQVPLGLFRRGPLQVRNDLRGRQVW